MLRFSIFDAPYAKLLFFNERIDKNIICSNVAILTHLILLLIIIKEIRILILLIRMFLLKILPYFIYI